jgi:hypothetical protein
MGCKDIKRQKKKALQCSETMLVDRPTGGFSVGKGITAVERNRKEMGLRA